MSYDSLQSMRWTHCAIEIDTYKHWKSLAYRKILTKCRAFFNAARAGCVGAQSDYKTYLQYEDS